MAYEFKSGDTSSHKIDRAPVEKNIYFDSGFNKYPIEKKINFGPSIEKGKNLSKYEASIGDDGVFRIGGIPINPQEQDEELNNIKPKARR